ncbi:MAG: hypothetical protein IJ286_08390 [Alistipes sp.]|nr:hypothetical protein [Alistipes sp.]
MKAFFAWQEHHQLSSVAIALYYTLLNLAGRCGKPTFSVAISTLSKHTGMCSRSVFRARDLLKKHQLISVELAENRDCAQYTILKLNDSDTKSHSATPSHTVRPQVIQCDTKSPLTSHTDTCTSIIINNDSMYSKFNVWLSQHAPRVQQMRQPMSEAQLCTLVSEYSKQEVMDVILAMENYADLHKKNISAYLTARNWLKRRTQVPQRSTLQQPKPGKVDTMLNILQRINNEDATYNSSDTTDPIMLEC